MDVATIQLHLGFERRFQSFTSNVSCQCFYIEEIWVQAQREKVKLELTTFPQQIFEIFEKDLNVEGNL
jgi:hypothetical protein